MKELSKTLKGREVRLFSSVSISAGKEAEMRATSALLSVLKAVSEFGLFFTKEAGAPFGTVQCFTEVILESKEKKRPRPDGVILVTRGKTQWKALVEVKVGSNGLDQKQFDEYQTLAKDYGFDALITISNQPALTNGHPPLKIDLRKAKSIPVIHFSWERLLSEAQLLSWQGSIADEDHEYILSEWIRYINDPNSKIVVAPKVGEYWNELLSAASEERLGTIKQHIEEFAFSWSGFMRLQAFRLRALLGESVELRLKRDEKKKPELFTKRLSLDCIEKGKINASFIIPHTAGDLEITFDLRARKVFFEVQLTPPVDKTVRGQISWIINQLKKIEEIPNDLSLVVDWKKRGLISMAKVSTIEEKREELLSDIESRPIEKGVEINSFRVQWKTKLSRKKTEVFSSIGSDTEKFYQGVVQQLKAYQPSAPKIPKKPPIDKGESTGELGRQEVSEPIFLPPWEDHKNNE